MGDRQSYRRGWYAVAIAVEILNVASTGVFLDVLFPVLGRQAGHWAPDLEKSCMESAPADGTACKVHILGGWVDVNAYYLYVRSIIVIFQGISVVIIGPLADDKWRRIPLLAGSAALSLIGGILFIALSSHATSSTLLVAGGITILQGTGFTLTQTFLNACLRDAADGPNEAARTITVPIDTQSRPNTEHTPLIPPSGSGTAALGPSSNLMTSRISAHASGIGIVAALGIVVVSMGFVDKAGNTAFSIEASLTGTNLLLGLLVGAGLWLMMGMGAGGDADLPAPFATENAPGRTWHAMGHVLHPSSIRHLPHIFRFLLFWAVVSDFLHILPSTIMLFLVSSLHVSPSAAALTALPNILLSAVAALILPPIQRRLRMSDKAILFAAVILAIIPGIAGSMPLWTGGRGGFDSLVATLPYRALGGVAYTIFFSWARAFFANIIPNGHESTFFSLFSLTDRGSSFFGPLIIGTITQLTGGFDWVWAFSAAIFALSLLLLVIVSPEQAVKDSARWIKEEKTDDPEHHSHHSA